MDDTVNAVQVSRISAGRVSIPIAGTAPLLMHRFSEKARKQMLDDFQGRKTPKQPKDPQAEYEDAFYRMKDGGYGFPAVAFKGATVGGARYYGRAVTMTALRQQLFVTGEYGEDWQALVPISGEPQMREDVTRNSNGGTDLRYRPMFVEWSATLQITYVKSALTVDSLVSLVDAGGMGVGVGDWRPERRGDFGTYTVDPTRNIEYLA